MTKDHSAETRRPKSGKQRNGLVVGAALVAIAGAGAVGYAMLSGDAEILGDVDSPVEDARPVGAGTFPDGEADELNEGLQNETSTDDFIEPGAPTEAFPNPLLDVPEDRAPTVPSIEQLDPGPAVDDEVLERMTPEAEADDGGTEGAETGETADDL